MKLPDINNSDKGMMMIREAELQSAFQVYMLEKESLKLMEEDVEVTALKDGIGLLEAQFLLQ